MYLVSINDLLHLRTVQQSITKFGILWGFNNASAWSRTLILAALQMSHSGCIADVRKSKSACLEMFEVWCCLCKNLKLGIRDVSEGDQIDAL